MSAADTIDPKAIPDDQAERRTLAEQLEQKALAAFGRGELVTATLHASDLLMLYPNERAYLDRFDEIVLSTEDPLSLLPVATGSVHVATAAGRARVLMMHRRLEEALEILSAVIAAAPELPYAYWAKRWLQPELVQSLPFDLLFRTIVRTTLTIGVGVPVPPADGDRRVLNLRAAADILEVIREAHPAESILWFGEALLRRRLGDPDATLAVAEGGASRFPDDARLRTALMNAYRDASRPDEALAQARAAMELEPDSLAPLHDAAWAFVDVGRMAEGASLFEELLSRDAGYPGGRACLAYARYKAHGDEADREALIRLRERMWWDEQVREFADEVAPPVDYYTVLPGPGDATGAAARHLLSELGHVIACCGLGGTLDMTLHSRHLDSPSVAVAFETGIRALGAEGRLHVEVESVQTPDPRQDKAPSSTPIWRYEGDAPVKVYPSGDPSAQEAVAAIAQLPFGKDSWDPAARALAERFGAEGYHPLVSVLTHPPAPPADDEFDAFTWTWRCQVATAVTLSHLGPWDTGYGRAALYSMAYGPSDWITGAALIAFAWRASDAPQVRGEVEPLFAWMRSQIPKEGFTAYELVLCEAWRGLGNHDDETLRAFDEWVDAYFKALPGKNRVGPPERRYGGLSLEDYARFSAERDRLLSIEQQAGAVPMIMAMTSAPPPELASLCESFGVPLHSQDGRVYPYILEWQEALNANPELLEQFLEIQRAFALETIGVSREEKQALDNILDGNMDMHQRMAQAQQAQRAVAEGNAGEPDPEVFPGQPVARLSDYVRILKGMQTGDMNGALAPYGLDMMSYGTVAQAWSAKMAADPVLTEKFNQMMMG